MKRLSVIALGAIFALPVLVCCGDNFIPQMSEIAQFEVIQVLGVDRCDDMKNLRITIVSGEASAGESGEGGYDRSMELLSVSAPTVSQAVAMLSELTDKRQHFGYVDYLVIGESAARDDLTKYTDYFTRDNETRYSARVFIARGASAKDLLEKTSSPGRSCVDSLDSLRAAADTMSNTSYLNISELVTMLDTPDCAAVIPALKLASSAHSHLVDGEMPKNILTPAGYGVVKDFKLAGFIDGECARGYNYLRGKARSSTANVKSPKSDTLVGVEPFSAEVTPHLRWDGDTLTGVTYEVCVLANITEQQAREDIYKVASLQDISTKVSDVIKSEMRRVISRSKALGIDCIGLGGQVRMRSPVRWHKLEDNWRELFPKLKIDVDVVTYIKRPLDIREPNGYSPEVS